MADEEVTNADGQDGGQDTGSTEQNAEFKGNSLMTKPGAENGGKGDPAGSEKGGDSDSGKEAGKDGKDADKDKDKGADDPADTVPDKPEDYDLQFGKDTRVDKELLGNFQKAVHDLGISRDKAQKLASFYETHAVKAGERAVEAQQKALHEARAKWEGEIEKSPTFTQDREHIRAALRQYGDQEIYDLLDQTNLGSHPKMWAFMANIGKALAEPGFHGKNSGKERSAADVLYPNQGK